MLQGLCCVLSSLMTLARCLARELDMRRRFRIEPC